jgi:hypothetical protein
MSEAQDLRQRRQALEAELRGLREQREHAFRANSDALSLQRAGVTHHNAAQMQQFADDETGGDSAMTELRREIELIDDELTTKQRAGGVSGVGRRIMNRLRR